MEGREKKRGSPPSHIKSKCPIEWARIWGILVVPPSGSRLFLDIYRIVVQDDPVGGARVEMAALTLRNWFYFCFIPHTVQRGESLH